MQYEIHGKTPHSLNHLTPSRLCQDTRLDPWHQKANAKRCQQFTKAKLLHSKDRGKRQKPCSARSSQKYGEANISHFTSWKQVQGEVSICSIRASKALLRPIVAESGVANIPHFHILQIENRCKVRYLSAAFYPLNRRRSMAKPTFYILQVENRCKVRYLPAAFVQAKPCSAQSSQNLA